MPYWQFQFQVQRGNRGGIPGMECVKDSMGLGLGRDSFPPPPIDPFIPSSTIPLQRRAKEALNLLSFHRRDLRMEKAEDLEEFVVEEGEKASSGCSSECQSGWTSYLCQSRDNPTTSSQPTAHEEGDDLSMISDASSGPPHVYCCSNDEDGRLTAISRNGRKRRKVEDDQSRLNEHSSFLNDTATSNSENLAVEDDMEFSCGFSANHFKRKAALHEKIGYLKSSSQQNQSPSSIFELSSTNEDDE